MIMIMIVIVMIKMKIEKIMVMVDDVNLFVGCILAKNFQLYSRQTIYLTKYVVTTSRINSIENKNWYQQTKPKSWNLKFYKKSKRERERET